MNKYKVIVEVSGYCRGYRVYEVCAGSEQEAQDIYDIDNLVDQGIVRDDREVSYIRAEKIED